MDQYLKTKSISIKSDIKTMRLRRINVHNRRERRVKKRVQTEIQRKCNIHNLYLTSLDLHINSQLVKGQEDYLLTNMINSYEK